MTRSLPNSPHNDPRDRIYQDRTSVLAVSPGETAMAPPDEERVEQIVLTIDLKACPMTEPVEGSALPTDCTVRLNHEAVPVGSLASRNYEGVMRILDFAKSNVTDLKIGLVTVE